MVTRTTLVLSILIVQYHTKPKHVDRCQLRELTSIALSNSLLLAWK